MPIPKMTASDIGWIILFMALFLPSMAIGMFVFAAYLTPAVLGSPNSVPREGVEMLVEFVLLFSGMALGMIVAVLIFCRLTRHFLSSSSYERWILQFENGAVHLPLPPIQLALGRYLMKFIKPKGQ